MLDAVLAFGVDDIYWLVSTLELFLVTLLSLSFVMVICRLTTEHQKRASKPHRDKGSMTIEVN